MAMRRLKLRKRDFVESRRCFCSKHSKKNEVVEDNKTSEASPSIKRSTLSDPRVFPKVAEVQEKVSGSWFMLKDILTEMKSKMHPNSQKNKNIVLEESVKSIKMEENKDNGKLDGPDKESILLTGMLNVEKSYPTGVEESKDPSLVKISENAEVPKPKQVEYSTELSEVEKSLGKEANNAEGLLLVNTNDNTKLPEYEIGECLMELLDVGSSHAEVKVSENQILVKNSDNVEHRETKQTKLSIEALASSTTDLGQNLSKLAGSTGHPVEEEENTRASISDMYSFDLKQTKLDSFEKAETDSLTAKENFPASKTAVSENKNLYLSDFFNKIMDKSKEISRTKIDTPFAPKRETSGLKDNSHVFSLVDIFKKNQKDATDKLNYEKKLERDGTMNLREPEAIGLLDRIIEVSKNAQKPGSSPNLTSKKANKFNGELFFPEESIDLPSLNEAHIRMCQCDKAKVGETEVQMERNMVHEENSITLVVADDRGQEKKSVMHEIGNWDQSNKNTKAEYLSEESDSDIAAFDYQRSEDSEPGDSIPLQFQRPNLDATLDDQMGTTEHRLLVKFLLKTANVNDLSLAFSDCGSISEIRIVNSRSENRFNYAYIFFKRAEGLKRALSKQDVAICGADVIGEPASSMKAYNRLFNAESVTDLDFPSTFLKNPSRTVVVKGSPEDLSFRYLTCSLSSLGRVSSIAMGSSPSNVYVEFQSEETKERALARATVSVAGKKFPILRIDAPKTTVVRISNVNPLTKLAKIRSICDSRGQVKRLKNRDADVFDVHFLSSEWSNMVNILNRLNGLVVDQQQWVAQPATIIPVDVLQLLWHNPKGRTYIHEMMQCLCRKIEANSIDTSPMLSRTREYYGES